jgi:hypothetical protein
MPIEKKQNNNFEENAETNEEEITQNTPSLTSEKIKEKTKKNFIEIHKKKFIIGGIIIAFLIIMICLIVSLTGKDKQKENPFDDGNDNSTNPEPTSSVNISHKLNEILKYHEETNQTTSVNFNGDNNSRLRNLAERKQLTIIKGDYLLIIYKIDDSVSPKLYYAYAILNNLSKQKDGSKEINYLGGVEDITLLNEVSNNLPLLRFNFDEKGKINNLEIPKNSNNIEINYIYEFIQKVIPEVNTESMNRRLNDNLAERTYKKEGEFFSITTQYKLDKFGNNEDSSDDRTTKVMIKDN